jgi:Fe-S-cluster containining protein
MDTSDVHSGQMRSATIDLTVMGRKMHVQLSVPTSPVASIQLLPIFRSLTDTFVQLGVENAQADGHTVSCRKGCGACCRQLVPISEVEVESIAALVDAMPEPRRSEVIDRFEHARQRLGDAGLLERLRHPESVTRQDVRALGTEYFEQGIPCPFLEEESCSIHVDRPLACREYLVTSPAANCARPSAETIRCITMPAKVSRAIRHLDDGNPQSSATWIPMILALAWPRKKDGELQSGTSLIAKAFEYLTGTRVPDPEP